MGDGSGSAVQRWWKVLGPDELPEGKVKAVSVGDRKICLVHFAGSYAALDNECAHQGGPLGDGEIVRGRLVCPWHGWHYEPLTGHLIGYQHGVASHRVEVRPDGVYVAIGSDGP